MRGGMALIPDTIAAPATPPGESAIALVRVSGPQVEELVAGIFGTGAPPRTVTRADYRNRQGRLLDDVLYTRFAAPNSYTGEDILEISCHGNPFIVLKILEDLFARGCRPAEAGEFTKRAFLHGRIDLSQAEAVMDLIHARSERALEAASRQLRGALGRQMEALINQVLECLAQVEAYIDFPEENLPPEDRSRLTRQLQSLLSHTARLQATSHYGEMLRSGIKTVILGAPNAGKSSLLNCLLGQDRALVSPEPGTTRDYLAEFLIVGPHRLRLVDTAGLNARPGRMEQLGIDKTVEQALEADLYLWVLDSTEPPHRLPEDIFSRMNGSNTIALWNKCDLPSSGSFVAPRGIRTLSVSSLCGTGLPQLCAAIIRLADAAAGPVEDATLAISARHAHALEQATGCLQDAWAKAESGGAAELLASDLRGALDAYGEISGKVDQEKMLDKLFSTFCIGK